jgi:hypothetical protein
LVSRFRCDGFQLSGFEKVLARAAIIDWKLMNKPTSWRAFFSSAIITFTLMALWAIASPLASVPDEASHAVRAAAVVRGEVVLPAFSGDGALAVANVPEYVNQMHQWSCYAREPYKTADCMEALPNNSDHIVSSVSSAATNSPVYYALVGWPSLFMSGEVALLMMRLASALLAALLFGIIFMQLSLRPRPGIPIFITAILTTPMVLYLGGSLNPNGVEALAAAAVFVTSLNYFESVTSSSRAAIAVQLIWLFISGTLLVSAKSIGLLWLLIACLLPLFLQTRQSFKMTLKFKKSYIFLAVVALLAVPAICWYFISPRYELGNVSPISAKDAMLTMILKTADLSNGLVGIFGWLDTPSPRISEIVWSGIALALVVAAGILGAPRYRRMFFVSAALFLAVPIAVQAVLAPSVGFIWQGRYDLAIYFFLVIAAALSISSALDTNAKPWRTLIVTLLVLVVVAQFSTFEWVLRRYMVGLDGSIKQLLVSPAWSPVIPLIPLSMMYLFVLIIGATACGSYALRRKGAPLED